VTERRRSPGSFVDLFALGLSLVRERVGRGEKLSVGSEGETLGPLLDRGR
jgi:hypothetical protein